MTTIITFLISNPWTWWATGVIVLIALLAVFEIRKTLRSADNNETREDKIEPRQSYKVTTPSREWFIPKEHEAECWRLYSEWMNKEGNDCYERYLFWRKVYDIFPEIQGCEDAEVDEEYDDIKMRITED